MHREIDFTEGLSAEVKRRLHQTDIYKDFMRERKRVSALAEEHVAQGGAYSDPVIVEEASRLETLGKRLQETVREIERGVAYKQKQ